jgi:phosphatidylglycerophosphate synthase
MPNEGKVQATTLAATPDIMSETQILSHGDADTRRLWAGQSAHRWLAPSSRTRAPSKHLTTFRLAFGLAAVTAFMPGTYGWANIGATLLLLSRFLDQTDSVWARGGEQPRRIARLYDLGSDVAIALLLFLAIGVGVGARAGSSLQLTALCLGAVAGVAVSVILFLRIRVAQMAAKPPRKPGTVVGFETEDVLYLLPVITVANALMPFLVATACGAPLLAIRAIADYRRARRRFRRLALPPTSGVT